MREMQKKKNRLHLSIMAALGCVIAGASMPVFAQGQIEEIIVTANRRGAENLQEVPVSIVAITGENLEARGMNDLGDLNGTVPNLNVMGSTGGGGTTSTSFTIRGIPNVGTYVDGIWQVGTSGMLTQEFIDVEQIEVLRGPQGTLYGRDSVGGAIRIQTRRPDQEFEAKVKATVGSLDKKDLITTVNIPVSDTLAAKFTMSNLYTDGYLRNRTVNQNNGGIDQSTLRSDIVWTPSDALNFRLIYNKSESSFIEPRVQDAIFLDAIVFPTNIIQIYTAAGAEITNNTQTSGYPGGEVGLWETNSEITVPNRIETEQLSLEVNYEFSNGWSIQSLTGIVEQGVTNFIDFENTQYALVEDLDVTGLESFSQEFKLSGGTDTFSWVTGVFYWDQQNINRISRFSAEEFYNGELDIQDAYDSAYCQQFAADAPGPSGNCQNAFAFFSSFAADSMTINEQDGYAVFGEGAYDISDDLKLTLGIRYHDQSNTTQSLAFTSETAAKPASSNTDFIGDPLIGTRSGDITPSEFSKTTGRASLAYTVNDDLMVYGSYSQGFSSGGVSVATVQSGNTVTFPYGPETLDTTELGFRSDWLDGSLRVNGTFFHTIWDDIQASGVVRDPDTGDDLPGLITTNIGEAKAQGAEFEVIYLPTRGFSIDFNLGLLDTKYTDIAPGTQGFDQGSPEFGQAPELTYSIGLQYVSNFSNGGMLTSRFDYTYSDEYRRSPNPTLRADYYNGVPAGFDVTGDFGMVNARVVYEPSDARWQLALFGTNLTDEYVLNSGFFHGIWGIDFATVGRPREVGVSLQVNFD